MSSLFPVDSKFNSSLLFSKNYLNLQHIIAQQNESIAALQNRLDNSLKLMDAAKVLTSTLNSNELFQSIIKQIIDIFELADAGLVVLYDEVEQRLKPVACFGYKEEATFKVRLSSCEGAPGLVFYYRSSRLWTGPEACAECIDPVNPKDRKLILEAISGRPFCQSLICAPFLVRGKVIGAIQLEHYRDQQVFTEQDLKSLSSIADVIAIALDNAHLLEELSQKEQRVHELLAKVIEAQEGERARVARDLHDGINQTLTALTIEVQRLETTATKLGIDSELIDRLEGLKKHMQACIHDTHKVAVELRPALLDDLGLASALEYYLSNYIAAEGIQTKLFADDLPWKELDFNIATILFRVTQEALNNVIRHSDAKRVDVYLTIKDKELCLKIEDDGRGFKLEQVLSSPERSLGLRGMAERVALIGGILEIKTAPGKGTKVEAKIKLWRDSKN